TAHPGAGIAGAALDRIGKDRRQERRFARRQGRCRTAESISGPGLRAELAGGAELGDVQIDFQDALLRQHQIDPERERKFQRLADHAAALPQEQIFATCWVVVEPPRVTSPSPASAATAPRAAQSVPWWPENFGPSGGRADRGSGGGIAGEGD